MDRGSRRTRSAVAALLLSSLLTGGVTTPAHAASPAEVIDLFGRTVNGHGVQLVDWQGYLANPYVELTVKPPADARYPVTVDLKAEGTSRLMMDLPSQLTATGATKTLTFAGAAERKTFKLAIHSRRGPGQDETHTLRLSVREAGGATSQQSMPIRVQQDEKTPLEPTLPVTFDYRYDTITGYFSDTAFRTASEEAVKDWFRFFDMAPFDTVAARRGDQPPAGRRLAEHDHGHQPDRLQRHVRVLQRHPDPVLDRLPRGQRPLQRQERAAAPRPAPPLHVDDLRVRRGREAAVHLARRRGLVPDGDPGRRTRRARPGHARVRSRRRLPQRLGGHARLRPGRRERPGRLRLPGLPRAPRFELPHPRRAAVLGPAQRPERRLDPSVPHPPVDADEARAAGGRERGLAAQPRAHPVPAAVHRHHLAPPRPPLARPTSSG
ncbi:hypothetical protein ACFSTC_32620 [Nonomuraea ferruginea]